VVVLGIVGLGFNYLADYPFCDLYEMCKKEGLILVGNDVT
jgi:hypothetical protein